MTRHEHILVAAMEECNEIAQRLSKALRFGLLQVQEDADDAPEENPEHLTNKQRIEREHADLVALLEMAGINPTPRRIYIDAKRAKFERHLQRSARCGTLTEEKSDG